MRPEIFLSIVDRADATATVLTGQASKASTIWSLSCSQRSGVGLVPPPKHHASAPVAGHRGRVFFMRHHTINSRHTDSPTSSSMVVFHASCRAFPGVLKLLPLTALGFPGCHTKPTTPYPLFIDALNTTEFFAQ